MSELVKLYDINKQYDNYTITNSYDKPYESLSFILNNYKSRLDIPNVFSHPTHISFDKYFKNQEYLYEYDNTKLVLTYYNYLYIN